MSTKKKRKIEIKEHEERPKGYSPLFAALDDESPSDHSYYIDSGASQHIVHSKELLNNYKHLSPPVEFGSAQAGVQLKAVATGVLTLEFNPPHSRDNHPQTIDILVHHYPGARAN